MIIALHSRLFIPVVITWIPSKWFSEAQENRFGDFGDPGSMVFLFKDYKTMNNATGKYSKNDVIWSFDINEQEDNMIIPVDSHPEFFRSPCRFPLLYPLI